MTVTAITKTTTTTANTQPTTTYWKFREINLYPWFTYVTVCTVSFFFLSLSLWFLSHSHRHRFRSLAWLRWRCTSVLAFHNKKKSLTNALQTFQSVGSRARESAPEWEHISCQVIWCMVYMVGGSLKICCETFSYYLLFGLKIRCFTLRLFISIVCLLYLLFSVWAHY